MTADPNHKHQGQSEAFVTPYQRYVRNKNSSKFKIKEKGEVWLDPVKPNLSDISSIIYEKWSLALHTVLGLMMYFAYVKSIHPDTNLSWALAVNEKFNILSLPMWSSIFAHTTIEQGLSYLFLTYLVAWRFGHLISVAEFTFLFPVTSLAGFAGAWYFAKGAPLLIKGAATIPFGAAGFLLAAQVGVGIWRVTEEWFLWLLFILSFFMAAQNGLIVGLVGVDVPNWYACGGAFLAGIAYYLLLALFRLTKKMV